MNLKDSQYKSILSKFLLNLPKQQLEDSSRLSYQAEKAYYYYLDVILGGKEDSDWKKQRLAFFNKLKQHAPSFLKINSTLFSEKLLESKPVCGAIVFNKDNSKVLVIRVREKLGFPKGKQNQGQTLADCAIREVEEETGINISSKIDSRTRIDFSHYEGKIFFFVAKGVAEEERIKIDKKEVDEVFWLPIEQLKKEVSTRFSEKSKLAWNYYERDTASRSSYQQQYAPKYFKKDCEQFDYKDDPQLHFQLDHEKLRKIFEEPKGSKSK